MKIDDLILRIGPSFKGIEVIYALETYSFGKFDVDDRIFFAKKEVLFFDVKEDKLIIYAKE